MSRRVMRRKTLAEAELLFRASVTSVRQTWRAGRRPGNIPAAKESSRARI
jgi:hypothetical protein